MASKLLERKKKTREDKKRKADEDARRRGSKHGTREDYEKDSYRWCYRESAAPKEVSVTVERVNGKLVKKRVTVDGVVTFEA